MLRRLVLVACVVVAVVCGGLLASSYLLPVQLNVTTATAGLDVVAARGWGQVWAFWPRAPLRLDNGQWEAYTGDEAAMGLERHVFGLSDEGSGWIVYARVPLAVPALAGGTGAVLLWRRRGRHRGAGGFPVGSVKA